MEHPERERREEQKDILERLDGDERELQARLFRLENAIHIYHSLAAEELDPDERDYDQWLESLPERKRVKMVERGFEECKKKPSFRRYVMERNDIGLEEWLRRNLSEDDYEHYCSARKETKGST